MPTLAVAETVDYRAAGSHEHGPVGFLDSRSLRDELSRADLFADARAIAGGLARLDIRQHDRVVLLLPTGPDHYATLWACLLSGVVACTVASPPKPGDPHSAGVRHVHAAVAAVQPRAVVVADAQSAAAAPAGVRQLTVDQLRAHGSRPIDELPVPRPRHAHHIQLTSGSTSAPKAVVLTHANVAANLAVLAAATDMRPSRDSLFAWLPLYHDMGLVQVFLTLAFGIRLDLMPPIAFIRDPLSWLRHMTTRRSTVTAAPPFAYRTVADRYAAVRSAGNGIAADPSAVRPDDAIDLSALRQAYVGAEPIPVNVLRAFRDTFAPRGLADDVLIPCYGMAETVLATTLSSDLPSSDVPSSDVPSSDVPSSDSGARSDTSFGRVRWRRFDRASLDENELATPPIPGRPARTIVSCGSVVPGLSLRITDGSGRDVPEGQVGTIKVSGSSVMAGYLNNGEIDAPPGGWHDTGDLGLRQDGQLYVVGRTKEMLIVRGRNLPPYDVEAIIEEHPSVAAGASAVFSHPTEDKGTEPIVAVVETRIPGPDWPQLRSEITARVRQHLGVSLTEVVFVARGGIPRTSSGKRRRAALRDDYVAGRLA